jgi:transmembrane protein TMEM260 (protein O-mannosyltransferase)
VLLPFLAGLGALAAYLALTPPVSGLGDGPEFTMVLANAGAAHPTGYPLYTLGGSLFVRSLHALGVPWPYAANAWSGVGAATAVAILLWLAARLAATAAMMRPAARWGVALLPAALLAFNPVLLHESVTAEVNSWHVAWTCTAAAIFMSLIARWESPAPESRAPGTRDAALWGLVAGVGLAHHLSSILVTVPLTLGLVIALRRRRPLRPAALVAGLAGAFLPLTSYGFVAWRAAHPAAWQWPTLAPSLAGLIGHVTGEGYRQFIGFFDPSPDQRALLATGIYPLLFPGIALLIYGGTRSASFERRVGWWSILAAALAVTAFGFRYGVPDPAPYFLPAVALGLLGLAPMIADLANERRVPGAIRLIAAGSIAAVVLVALAGWVRDAAESRRELIRYDRAVRAMWAVVPAESAIVIWPADQYVRLIEYQVLDKEKPGLYVTNPDMLLEPVPRERFKARFGIDPAGGLAIPYAPLGAPGGAEVQRRFLRLLVERMNQRVGVKVILFDPSIPLVRELRKPP